MKFDYVERFRVEDYEVYIGPNPLTDSHETPRFKEKMIGRLIEIDGEKRLIIGVDTFASFSQCPGAPIALAVKKL
jgi:hypothetical protein